MNEHNSISMSVDLQLDVAAVEDIVRRALSAEGFGVLTEIDVQQTLREKLNVALPAYRILGACNPSLAHRAITAMPEVGVLLPCNVVLRDIEPGTTRVDIADPFPMLRMLHDSALLDVATEARQRLARVVDVLRHSPDSVSFNAPVSAP